jgi:hypothetical protein
MRDRTFGRKSTVFPRAIRSRNVSASGWISSFVFYFASNSSSSFSRSCEYSLITGVSSLGPSEELTSQYSRRGRSTSFALEVLHEDLVPEPS